MLGSGLICLKAYNIGRHIKFIDSIKYYQQPLSKLARSANAKEQARIKSLFLDYLGYINPYYSKFFMCKLSHEDRQFALEYLRLWKGLLSLRDGDRV